MGQQKKPREKTLRELIDEAEQKQQTTSPPFSRENTSGRLNMFRLAGTQGQIERMNGNSRETDIELPSPKKTTRRK